MADDEIKRGEDTPSPNKDNADSSGEKKGSSSATPSSPRPKRPRGRRGGRGRGRAAAKGGAASKGSTERAPKEAGEKTTTPSRRRGPAKKSAKQGETSSRNERPRRKAPEKAKEAATAEGRRKLPGKRPYKGFNKRTASSRRGPVGDRRELNSQNHHRRNTPKPHLSLVIPAYNEDKLIESTLNTVCDYLTSKRYTYEVIVVDDGSVDRTVELAENIKKKRRNIRVLENGDNRGKGYSVRNGILNARGKFICFSDADLSTPIEEIDALIKWLEGDYDVAIGSRALKDSRVEVHQPRWREFMGKGFNLLVQIMAVRGIKDTQCGFKCFTAEAAKEIFDLQTLDGFSFDVEALFIAKKHGLKIKESPVRWINRFESRVDPILHPIQMLFEVIKIRLWSLGGKYKKQPPVTKD